MNKMGKFSITGKLYISIILALSIVLVPQIISNTLYAQNNSIISNGSMASLNKTSTGPTAIITDSISIPVSIGYVNGNISYFIATDASIKEIVSSVANTTHFNINYAPSLANTSESSRQQGYVFTNGVKGDDPTEFQPPVASFTPDDEKYSPLFEINYVKWNDNSKPRILKSVDEITKAQNDGEISITKTNIVINSPSVTMK